MNKFDRIYDLSRILQDRRTPISLDQLAERMECSRPTVKRALQKLREEFGAPIRTIRGQGYVLEDRGEAGVYELPGLWFNASELHALLSAHHLLKQVEPGLLSDAIRPLKKRIESLLDKHHNGSSTELVQRIHIAGMGARGINKHRFRIACDALVNRRQVAITYHARSDDQQSQRTISPQRLTHYRNNWYLDAWCHHRGDMRRFALDRIEAIEPTEQSASEISPRAMDDHSSAYGIFAGPGEKTATLRCSPQQSRWLAEEQWHPNQHGEWLSDGRFELIVPFSDPTELAMDILRHGPEIEVIDPPDLRDLIRQRLESALAVYQS